MALTADYVIVGSGIAALRASIGLADAGELLVLTKAEPAESNTDYAQGGIAAAVGPDDSPARHGADTQAAGDGLCDPGAVEILVHEGPHYVRELAEWGTRFDREPDGRLALAREAAHSVRRVLYSRDATGREIGRTLWARLSASGPPRVLPFAMATDAIVRDGVCVGVRFIDADGEYHEARGKAVLLATGGAGQIYRFTTNPRVATGDGMALAFRAGARVADLEFVQFHPTALRVPGAPPFLLSEALRGEGALLVNETGEAFMEKYEPQRELAPRDRVARAIAREAARTGSTIYLSLRHLPSPWVHERFPAISAACRSAGLDLALDAIPVAPAAHYAMGGVVTDLDGRTSVPGLFAAGEAACTGVHGANRLASNSLLEGLVFGARAALAMRRFVARGPDGLEVRSVERPGAWADASFPTGTGRLGSDEVRQVMWNQVGLVRDRRDLDAALAALREDAPGGGGIEGPVRQRAEAANIRLVAWLTARAALRREESRGAHFREDFPVRDDSNWLFHASDQRDEL